jgi:hypothetical protein
MSDDNWNDLAIEISTDPEQPDTIWLTTTAHDFEGAQFDGVDFDGDQYEADIDAELAASGWKRTSDLVNSGGYTDVCTVERVAA